MIVLLICPNFPETFGGINYTLRFMKKQSAFPPPGLLNVAALLPEE